MMVWLSAYTAQTSLMIAFAQLSELLFEILLNQNDQGAAILIS
jgi:hypothetical protein